MTNRRDCKICFGGHCTGGAGCIMQGDLFNGRGYPDRPGYVRDSDTSKGAADSLSDEILSKQKTEILAFIGAFANGRTCDHVEEALGLRHQTASARIRELVLADKLYDTEKRALNRSGRPARLYKLKQEVKQ